MTSILRVGLCALLVGCGGAVASNDGGTNTDGGSDATPLDGSPCQFPVPECQGQCPDTPPFSGSTCTQDTLTCEYGTNPDPSCNQTFQCNGGVWQDQSSGTICPPQSDCPSTFAQIPNGQDCTPNGLQCAYPQGECICTTSFGGLQKQTPAWDCFPAATGCPSPRPDIGSHCSGPTNQQCDYGACSGGVALECKQGVWQQVITPCPG